ncbi:MAG: GTPase Era [Proteobacteria bacterium]|nr:GTPase Era [Pseudomonadota bacterium]
MSAMSESSLPPETTEGEKRRCGFVAVIGPTNAGKSTLVNALVGAKVAIVSHKVQTTRAPIRGIAMEGNSQIVFIDTAGIFNPKRRLDRAMVEAAWGGLEDADAALLVLDAAAGLSDDVAGIIERLGSVRMPKIAVLNKIDRVEEKPKLLELAKSLGDRLSPDRVFMVSALEGQGVRDLRTYLADLVPEGPWHYAEDDVTDVPMRTQAAEMTRESIYRFLHQELPYTTTVETTDWKDLKDGSARIEQTIYVERDGQKKIVLGKGGETIKKISSAARRAIEEMAGHRVHLFLFVKVRENWESDPERYREMGLPFPKS